ncbi:hypothetical protein HY29_07490 [Hyphomonas beringensis]|uniref:Uncharacterized protein n=1 Tax=Hyphomonas beringensis TaxID=1280946 RepID=A0A062UGY9_9PROT|nr:hypothetical protein [Hyphomonas beringensis]KCZ56978.1 hypothetical protein HY29_07490 [Hyphomonas beringensis]
MHMHRDTLISRVRLSGRRRLPKTSTLFIAWLIAGPMNPLWYALGFAGLIPTVEELSDLYRWSSPLISGTIAFFIVVMFRSSSVARLPRIWMTCLKAYLLLGVPILLAYSFFDMSRTSLFVVTLVPAIAIAMVIIVIGATVSSPRTLHHQSAAKGRE